MMARSAANIRLSASCCLTRLTAPASPPSAPTGLWRGAGANQVTELLQGRSLKDLDVFTPPTFDDEEVAEHANLETHFIDSSGLISRDMFKQDADYPFVDWSFSGTTEEEFATLMAIFKAEDKEVYIADYEHLGVYACRIIVPGMSDIYPAEDLWLANNSMGAHLRDTILSLPGSEWDKADYLALIRADGR